MFNVENFTSYCDSMAIDLASTGAFEAINLSAAAGWIAKNVGNAIDVLIKFINQVIVWLKGMMGKLNGTYYEEALDYLGGQYSELGHSLCDDIQQVANTIGMVDAWRTPSRRDDASLKLADIEAAIRSKCEFYESPAFKKKVEDINSQVWNMVDRAIEYGVEPVKIDKGATIRDEIDDIIKAMRKAQQELNEAKKRVGLEKEGIDSITRIVKPMLININLFEKYFNMGMQKCTWENRNDQMESVYKSNELKFIPV